MDKRYDISRLIEAIDRFPKARVLVIGDVILDEYIWGTVDRISPEAPIPVINVNRENRLLGGAANVVNNILTVGGHSVLAGVVGPDRSGRQLVEMLKELKSDTDGIFIDDARSTTVKTRVLAHSQQVVQQVVRFDREQRFNIDRELTDKIVSYLERIADSLDAVLIEDYGKGVITSDLMDGVRQVLKERGTIITVDPNVANFSLYSGVTTLTPNHHEASAGSGVIINSEETLRQAGEKIIKDLDCDTVLITKGELGMSLFERQGRSFHIPSMARDVFDGTGAGDTVIAILTLGLASGLSMQEAAVLSNYAGGIVCGKVGCASVTPGELKSVLLEEAGRPE